MIRLNNYIITPTIFPDKTSQVWKLPKELSVEYNKIIWDFENEAEFIHIAQLCDLLTGTHIELQIPYFPYARQDKDVSNTSTFALRTFCRILDALPVNLVKTYDLHSNVAKQILKKPLIVESADQRIKDVMEETCTELVVFPDAGAKTRYGVVAGKTHVVYFTKIRNQLTGEITGMSSDNDEIFKKVNNILIVDDLCDGGATFTHIAKYIKNITKYPEINLYTSHGLYTKGTQILKDNGINRIFNRLGEV